MTDKVTAHGFTTAQVSAWVDSTCAAQGVPVVVTDLGVLARVGVLIGGTRRKPPGGRDRLQPPLGSDPFRVETCPASVDDRQDHNMVEYSLHDRRLAG